MLLLWYSPPPSSSWPRVDYNEWTYTRDMPETIRAKEDEEILLLWWSLYQ